MISDEKIVCTKFVDPDQIYNFVVDKIFIWGCFGNDIGVSNLKFEISKLWNDLGWKNSLYKSYRSQPDVQLCSWKHFHLRLL